MLEQLRMVKHFRIRKMYLNVNSIALVNILFDQVVACLLKTFQQI